jgi:parallel beta-helix repeat protein
MKPKPSTTRFIFFVILLLGLIPLTGLTGAAEIYVAPGGNNSNPGTQANPVQTIARAVQLAETGSRIILRGGTYNESVWLNNRSPQNLTFAAFEGESPLLQVTSGSVAVSVSNASGMRFEGLEIRQGGMVLMNGAQNIVVESCLFSNSESYATLNIQNAQNVIIENSVFLNGRGTNTVLLTGDNSNIQVRNSEFTDNFSQDSSVQAVIMLSGQEPEHPIIFEDNLFTWTGDKESRPVIAPGNAFAAVWIQNSDGGNFTDPAIVFQNNHVEHLRFRGTNNDQWYNPAYLKTPEQGGEQGNAFSVLESSNIRISNNTIYNISAYGVNGFMVDHLRIEGNSFLESGKNGVFLVGDQSAATGASPNLIADNRIRNCGWLKGGTSGISTMFTGPGNLILRNFVTGQRNGTAGTVGADWYGDGNGILADLDSSGTFIFGNVVVHNEGAGISMNRASNCVILHNTVVGNGSMPHRSDNAGILISGGAGPANNVLLANNLVYNNRLAQFWVWMTALDHTVRYNLFASGPLTRPERQTPVIDWYGTMYTVATWAGNPPRAGNGIGSVGERPVFLGDLIGGDPREDLFYYLPVNTSAGTAAAQEYTAFDSIGLPSIYSDLNVFNSAIVPLDASPISRSSTGANIGALEPPASITQGWLGRVTLTHPTPNASEVFSERLKQPLAYENGGSFSPRLGHLQPMGQDDWLISSRFGFLYAGNESVDTQGWLWSERFGWMKFELDYLWANHLQTWFDVRPDGTFYSFDFGFFNPVNESLTRYNTRIGPVTANEDTPPGWLASDNFGFVWFARDGTGIWFWSENRQEWIGITPGGGLWSTAENRFL